VKRKKSEMVSAEMCPLTPLDDACPTYFPDLDDPLDDELRAYGEFKKVFPDAQIKFGKVSPELKAWIEIVEKDKRIEALDKFIKTVSDPARWKKLNPTLWKRAEAPCQVLKRLKVPEAIQHEADSFVRDRVRDIVVGDEALGFDEEEAVCAAALEFVLPALDPNLDVSRIGALETLFKMGVLTLEEEDYYVHLPKSRGWKEMMKG